MSFVYEYPRPALCADVLVFHKFDDSIHNEPFILLIKRNEEPHKGSWALPGGYVEEGETSKIAASRELSEETGLEAQESNLYELGLYDDPNRDPRKWVISNAFVALYVGDKSGDDFMPVTLSNEHNEYIWAKVSDALQLDLAFDHKQMITDALDLVVELIIDNRVSKALAILS